MLQIFKDNFTGMYDAFDLTKIEFIGEPMEQEQAIQKLQELNTPEIVQAGMAKLKILELKAKTQGNAEQLGL